MESKKPWQSKTLIFNALLAFVALFSETASTFIGENQESALLLITVIGNFVLRLFTDKRIELKKA